MPEEVENWTICFACLTLHKDSIKKLEGEVFDAHRESGLYTPCSIF